jgi:predicted Rossmann fold nucleotide-binding protein DprA/Smf involved in DNA uptake
LKAIQEARRLIESRLQELDGERDRLIEALRSLPDSAPTAQTRPPRNARKQARRGAKASSKRAGRGERQRQFISEITATPGATMTEIARRMGVAPQQLYPIARRLESEGAIVKNDKGYAPTNAKDDQVTV